MKKTAFILLLLLCSALRGNCYAGPMYFSGGGGGIGAETDPIVGAVTGLVKADGGGNMSAAVAGTDYAAWPQQSDCSGITSGCCLDTDDGLYYCWDSASVALVGPTTLTHASQHNDGGSDEVDRLLTGITLQTFGDGDTDPDVTNGGSEVHHFWKVHGSSSPTIDDFDDGDDHSEFSDGEWFYLLIDFTPTIEFADNANIEGNANTNFTGSASQEVLLLFVFENTQWKCSTLIMGMSDPTTLAVASIAVPTHKASELNDSSDPHLLTVAELKNSILSNEESTGADEWDFPARTEGWNFCFMIEAAQNVILDPNGAEQWYFNKSQMAAGEPIVNEAPTVSEQICCVSTEDDVFCISDDADWAEDTP